MLSFLRLEPGLVLQSQFSFELLQGVLVTKALLEEGSLMSRAGQEGATEEAPESVGQPSHGKDPRYDTHASENKMR